MPPWPVPASQAGPSATAPADDAARCAALAQHAPSVATRIDTAAYVQASADAPWVSPDGFRGKASVRQDFCRVTGSIAPEAGSDIRFELWLPPAHDWNGRFYGTAAGGSMGAIQYAALPDPLARGFAAMAHDNGHRSRNTYEQSWAFDEASGQVRESLVVDFASRAQHVATVVAKELTRRHYGGDIRYSYFIGCSQGGHHGMMEAQRYPEDYDGIVAGAHGGNWTGMLASQAWAAWQVTRNGGAGALTSAQLARVNQRVVAACDAHDGLEDGQIEDPRQCDFDPAVMQCGHPQAEADLCLSEPQVTALRAIYDGPHDPRTGQRLAPGIPRGSERFWSWTDQLEPFSGSYFDFNRLIVQRDPAWRLDAMDWSRDIQAGRERWSSFYDAVDPDLSALREAGGKLILYHGWADALITPFLSTDAWEAMRATMGAEGTDAFARLFMIPDMSHCSGGPIGGTRDLHDERWLTAIQDWVEHGIAPDATTPRNTVIGTGVIDGRLRTRPYCPYPKVARYGGAGSINHAGNFTCVAP